MAGKQHLNYGTPGVKTITMRQSVEVPRQFRKTAQMMLQTVRTVGVRHLRKPLKLRETPLTSPPTTGTAKTS